MKSIAIVFLAVSSLLSFSTPVLAGAKSNCAQALPNCEPGFCDSFKDIAICHCAEILPKFLCKDMNTIYDRMIMMFGTIEKACEWQQDTSKQNCIDNWDCYRKGGKNSNGKLCSGTGKKCA